MKIAASIFTWLGVIVNIIVYGIFAFSDTGAILKELGYNAQFIAQNLQTLKTLFLVLFIVSIVIDLSIAIWREISVKNEKFILVGILTLILVSFLGGLLTILLRPKRPEQN